MKIVFVIERTTSWMEGMTEVEFEVYGTLDMARQRLTEMFAEDSEKAEPYEPEVKQSDDAYELDSWAETYRGKILEREVK